MKKIVALFLASALAVSGILALLHGTDFPIPSFGALSSGDFSAGMESFFSKNLPGRDELSLLADRLLYLSGRREFDGVFLGEDGSLLKNIEPPETDVTAASAEAIGNFVSDHRVGACVMLIPTAAVIKQQEINSAAADRLYNQRHMISEAYATLSGKAVTADVYQSLFAHRGEYIYYNTEENLTALGGYYVYSEYASALNLRGKPISDFNVAYAAHGFKGSLAKGVLADYAAGDFVAMYAYTQYEREYSVAHTSADGVRTEQQGLYDRQTASQDPTDVLLGGLAPVTEIETDGPYEEWLLVFGDATAKSWLPFLANHYAHITYVDLGAATDGMLAAIRVSDYQQVLFAYSAETFLEGAGLGRLTSLAE
ncbi:MAG TPA: DHHW family protein [Oscillospiraceae bacterium]|nr:hypothetical protein [Oscillospiraceae bacterium]HNW04149.1 DHHW family protein [Oscillospiraceae bacterium]HPV99600.1 DHHW family protein [Oscillospiraceae bacterium]